MDRMELGRLIVGTGFWGLFISVGLLISAAPKLTGFLIARDSGRTTDGVTPRPGGLIKVFGILLFAWIISIGWMIRGETAALLGGVLVTGWGGWMTYIARNQSLRLEGEYLIYTHLGTVDHYHVLSQVEEVHIASDGIPALVILLTNGSHISFDLLDYRGIHRMYMDILGRQNEILERREEN